MRKSDSADLDLRINQRSYPDSGKDPIQPGMSDELLVARVAQGDSDALEMLYDRYAPVVMGFTLNSTGDRSQAEDLLQETFWRVWRYSADFQVERGPFIAWLFRIARNLIIDAHRRSNARPRLLEASPEELESNQILDPGLDVAEQALTALKHQQVRRAVSALPDEQKRAIELAYFYGLTRLEIAEATGDALGTVHTRVRLGLQKLRQELQKHGILD
jgi:RNA polymerase sigma-70 factor (ECF subfamily)